MVMHFGLEKAKVKQLIKCSQIFIVITMEVYIDERLVKSFQVEIHLKHLKETFHILRN